MGIFSQDLHSLSFSSGIAHENNDTNRVSVLLMCHRPPDFNALIH